MSVEASSYDGALGRASAHARSWLASIGTRPVGPAASADEIAGKLGGPLPAQGTSPEEVIDRLAAIAEPGLMAIGSGRFYGWVMGGVLPAALGADWLVSAWDQNTGLRYATPATAAAEEVAASWLLDLLGLPATADVGFVTGGMMANFTCLAAARTAVLTRVGWDLNQLGLTGAPRVRVICGAERHETIDIALRYLGLGAPELVEVDAQGRLDPRALEARLASPQEGSPIIVCLQAGNVHSGAFDPIEKATALAHARGAWVHVDGAFGLWAAAAPSLARLVSGLAEVDSCSTDAHKTLNVPYDSGLAIVMDPDPLRAVMGVHGSYLVTEQHGRGDPMSKVPEYSRRARGVPVWAALLSLGRSGVASLVETMVENARVMAERLAGIEGVTILNDVVYTQVCLAIGDEETTRAVTAKLIAGGTVWMSGSRWHGREVLRISMSNWSTDADDIERSVAAVRDAIGSIRR
jgi:glutamate/tyrosine decarboxylase-like PLP-dependent enzyme